jgi:hypothetical protein
MSEISHFVDWHPGDFFIFAFRPFLQLLNNEPRAWYGMVGKQQQYRKGFYFSQRLYRLICIANLDGNNIDFSSPGHTSHSVCVKMVDEHLLEFAAVGKGVFELLYGQADYGCVPQAGHLFRSSECCLFLQINVCDKWISTLILLHIPAKISGKCDRGYSNPPDPFDYVLG